MKLNISGIPTLINAKPAGDFNGKPYPSKCEYRVKSFMVDEESEKEVEVQLDIGLSTNDMASSVKLANFVKEYRTNNKEISVDVFSLPNTQGKQMYSVKVMVDDVDKFIRDRKQNKTEK
jgi:hypothetical protein